MSLTPAELIEAAKAVNQPPFTNNAVLAAKLRAEGRRVLGAVASDARQVGAVESVTLRG